ncbi:MAG: helix-turn-helix transcriptional regulator [Treponema sp.]|nr:helix-turn-helix transcriptional regulator [Treponema sp.]
MPLKAYLSANIKARREALGISQERLAELADVSVQMVRRIEGRRTWVSDRMLANLAEVLGVSAFQLLIPAGAVNLPSDLSLLSGILDNLKRNIRDDINRRFDALVSDVPPLPEKPEKEDAPETAAEDGCPYMDSRERPPGIGPESPLP